MSDSNLMERRLQRERQARKAAEELLEQKSLDLWNANEALRAARDDLELRVIERTRELSIAKHAAEAGNRAKSSFLAVISHEIRTPMNAVVGLLELLSLSQLDAQQRDTVETARDSSKSLMRLIDDVLDFSRIEAGKLKLQEEPAALPHIFKNAQKNFGPLASEKGIELRWQVDPRIAPALQVDRLRLRQIINNFLSNAIKFTERGEVELSAELVEQSLAHDRVRIQVRDTGIGMNKSALDCLFEPFSQAEAGIERRYGGTGIGLAICHRLAQLMGAVIDVSSTPGNGTLIGLTLQARHAAPEELKAVQPERFGAGKPAAPRPKAPTVSEARARGTLVLVVDDHPINRTMLARQMSVLGYAAQTATGGQEALDILRGGGIALLVTDCQMPDMDGFELTRAIRLAEPPGKRLPIVACTANVQSDVYEECRAVGMDQVLAKPVELAALQRMLEQWLPSADGGPAREQQPAPVSALSAIAELAQGDAALERELIDEFRQANDSDFADCATAIRANAVEGVRRAAHRIKGAARMVGARGLSLAATELERAAGAHNLGQLASLWANLERERKRLDRSIVQHQQCPS